jgi:hypothetical protein
LGGSVAERKLDALHFAAGCRAKFLLEISFHALQSLFPCYIKDFDMENAVLQALRTADAGQPFTHELRPGTFKTADDPLAMAWRAAIKGIKNAGNRFH